MSMRVIEKNEIFYIIFEVLTMVVMKSFVFWDIMPCSPLKVNKHFREMCALHLYGIKE
jgi:hypothetical protein